MIIARSPRNDLQVIASADEARYVPKLLTRGWTMYRVSPDGNGRFLLTPMRVKAGTAVTEQVIVSVELEDDI